MNEYQMLMGEVFESNDLMGDITECLLANGHSELEAKQWTDNMAICEFGNGRYVYMGQKGNMNLRYLMKAKMLLRGVR